VQRDYVPIEPPAQLFHGTAERFLVPIRAEGLKPGRRHHVHLSADEATAVAVGRRHGHPVVLRVDAAGMRADGHEFYQAENGVWLTAAVPSRYLAET
jgi:putative RNA 2'-phosphotransferase